MANTIVPRSQKPIAVEFSNLLQRCMNLDTEPKSWAALSSFCYNVSERLMHVKAADEDWTRDIAEQIANLEDIEMGARVMDRDGLPFPKRALTNKPEFRRSLLAARTVGRFAKDLSRMIGRYSHKYFKNGDQNPTLDEAIILNDRLIKVIQLNTEELKKLKIEPPSASALIEIAIHDRRQEVLPSNMKMALFSAFKIVSLEGEDHHPQLPFMKQDWYKRLALHPSKSTLD